MLSDVGKEGGLTGGEDALGSCLSGVLVDTGVRELERRVYQDDSKRVLPPSRGFIYEEGRLIWVMG